MDYNYVRMRNAVRDGNTFLADRYRRMYEKGKSNKNNERGLNVALIILLFVTVSLGIYAAIVNGAERSAQNEVQAQATEQPLQNPVVSDVESTDDNNAEQSSPSEGNEG